MARNWNFPHPYPIKEKLETVPKGPSGDDEDDVKNVLEGRLYLCNDSINNNEILKLIFIQRCWAAKKF